MLKQKPAISEAFKMVQILRLNFRTALSVAEYLSSWAKDAGSILRNN